MKKILILTLLVTGEKAYACTTCSPDLKKAIFDSTFYPNLFTMMLAFIILAWDGRLACDFSLAA